MIPKFRAWDGNNLFDVDFLIYPERTVRLGGSRYRKFDEVKLMQSTGLFDKNGVEIFEGDIIDTTDYEGGLISVGNPLVEIRRDNYGFTVVGDFPISPITLKDFEDGRKLAGVDVSVIGNIYKNPELLEEKDEN